MKKSKSSADNLTFKRVWQMFRETDRKFQETDRKFQETILQIRETDRKLRQLEELFVGQWGKLIESLVEGELIRILRERGMEVTRVSSRQLQILDGKAYEIDLLAKNGNEVVVVEVKTSLGKKDVDRFVEKLKLFTKAFPEFRNYKVYGAVAFIRSTQEYTRYAYRKGLFVIRAVGENARILNDSAFKPHNFNEAA